MWKYWNHVGLKWTTSAGLMLIFVTSGAEAGVTDISEQNPVGAWEGSTGEQTGN